MNSLVIGATGYVGSGIARALKNHGHTVTGFARSNAAEKKLQHQGFLSVKGELSNLSELTEIAKQFENVIFSPMVPYEEESIILRALIEGCLAASGCLTFISGTGVLASPALEGQWSEQTFAENDEFTPPAWLEIRVQTEQLIKQYCKEGLRAMIIRPPLVWGNGGSKQIPSVFDSVKKTAQACYLGNGLNLYSNVHVDDLGALVAMVIDKGATGNVYHAVAGEADFRQIAEAVAVVMNTTTRSVGYEEACDIWGEFMTQFGIAVNSRSRCPNSKALGWQPKHLDMIEDIRTGSYKEVYGPK